MSENIKPAHGCHSNVCTLPVPHPCHAAEASWYQCYCESVIQETRAALAQSREEVRQLRGWKKMHETYALTHPDQTQILLDIAERKLEAHPESPLANILGDLVTEVDALRTTLMTEQYERAALSRPTSTQSETSSPLSDETSPLSSRAGNIEPKTPESSRAGKEVKPNHKLPTNSAPGPNAETREARHYQQFQLNCRARSCGFGPVYLMGMPEDRNCPRCCRPLDIMGPRTPPPKEGKE